MEALTSIDLLSLVLSMLLGAVAILVIAGIAAAFEKRSNDRG